ncbi:uracil-DNA glycosylase [Paraburkholderia ginsengiterrae]|uniref:Type-4 uracil-DNA glycosylase n=1 Tax=Paraburkholderia ginsengiterrae TaxID=1462993 RepID=A0A1A9N456_9BURK|nr:UdgX family uracil-DNA binding protein [Paraburkholderia ginsengiterrae]OAJ53118.1 uracil-DNA glycosylase [Paraburkholderia ginsengiterrae]OAJ55817.1 uracil-DNA glycosylase [Paraburkholderia ginsengiterrae]
MKRISIEPSFAAWRRAARELLRQGIEPERIEWVEADGGAEATGGTPENPGLNPAPAIPRELLARLKTAACFRAPDRWSLLYRVVWRWTHGERDALAPDDRDGALLDQRIQSVEQETENLVLLTLFRRRDPSMGLPEFVGWYEPRNDLLERAAARFAARMGDSTWMLATPSGAAFWNGMLLRIGRPAAPETGAPPLALQAGSQGQQATQALQPSVMDGEAVTSEPTEALWLAYYASVFNALPAPVPLRYWRTPPVGPPLPARLTRERSRLGAQSGTVTVPKMPPIEYSATTPPLRDPAGPPATCRRCALWRNARQAVTGAGPAEASLMVVGEQPGEHENQHGEPFTGPAGQLLDTVLARAGLERAALYLTYAVKHYKWEILEQQRLEQQRVHRTPAWREVEACQYWLEKELAQVAPRVVVTLGATALKALTGPHVNLSEYLGQTIAHDGRLIVPTWHPSYALRTADSRLREDIVAGMVAAFGRAAGLVARPNHLASHTDSA